MMLDALLILYQRPVELTGFLPAQAGLAELRYTRSPPSHRNLHRKKGVLTKVMGCRWQPDPSFKSPFSFFLIFNQTPPLAMPQRRSTFAPERKWVNSNARWY
jgi:hypothetical protein